MWLQQECAHIEYILSKSADTHHLTFIGVIKPFQQLNTGAFPTTAAPNERQSLTRLHGHKQAFQHLGVWSCRIGKLAVEELNLPSEIVLKMHNNQSNTVAYCNYIL